MKTWSLLITALALFLFAPAPAAKADHGCRTRVSYCGGCGDAVRWVYRCVGYDCHGCPIYRWVRLPHTCCHHHSVPSYGHGCQSGHGHGHSHSHGGISLWFGGRR